MKASASYMSVVRHYGGEKFWCQTLGDNAFYYGVRGKEHFRLIAIAVKEDCHGKGMATALLTHLFEKCAKEDIKTITLRTHKGGKALNFWKKIGAKIIGEKGDDYEMRIEL